MTRRLTTLLTILTLAALLLAWTRELPRHPVAEPFVSAAGCHSTKLRPGQASAPTPRATPVPESGDSRSAATTRTRSPETLTEIEFCGDVHCAPRGGNYMPHPVANARVLLVYITDGVEGPEDEIGVTGEYGVFAARVPRPEGKVTARLRATAPGFADAEPVTIDPDDRAAATKLLLYLPSLHRVFGRVLDVHARPIANALVHIRDGWDEYDAVTDERGEFSFEAVPPSFAKHEMDVRRDGFARTRVPVKTALAGDAAQDIVLQRNATVTVQLVDSAGNCINEKVFVDMRDLENRQFEMLQLPKKDMSMLWASVPDARYLTRTTAPVPPDVTLDLTFHVEGYEPSTPIRVTLAPGQVIEVGTVTLLPKQGR